MLNTKSKRTTLALVILVLLLCLADNIMAQNLHFLTNKARINKCGHSWDENHSIRLLLAKKGKDIADTIVIDDKYYLVTSESNGDGVTDATTGATGWFRQFFIVHKTGGRNFLNIVNVQDQQHFNFFEIYYSDDRCKIPVSLWHRIDGTDYIYYSY